MQVNALSEGDCKLVMAQVTSAMAHLHVKLKVAHRDLKSANILCCHPRTTEPGCIKLADFGFAYARHMSPTSSHAPPRQHIAP